MSKNGSSTVTLVREAMREECLLEWSRDLVDGRDQYTIRLTKGGQVVTGVGSDMFEALVELRRKFESKGWLIAVQGSRRDAYPSGMARDMGGGERIYVLRRGMPAKLDDLVDTLAAADPSQLATVEEQEQYWEDWLKK